jgi:hypothetical protein
VRIVESGAPAWGSVEGWVVESVPLVQIGEREGTEPYQFTAIAQAIVLPGARFAAVDSRAFDIRVFDITGRHIATLGGRGDGPGEFSAPPVIAFAPPDAILAFDTRRRRFSRFRLDGGFVEDRPLGQALEPAEFRVAPASIRGLLPDGTLLIPLAETIGLSRPPVATPDTFRVDLSVIRAWGDSLVDIGEYQTGEIAFKDFENVRNPFAPRHLFAMGGQPASVYVTNTGSWEIRAHSLDGVATRMVRATIPRGALTSEMVQAERSALLEAAAAAGRDVDARAAAFDVLSFSDSTPAFDALHVSEDGSLWARRWSNPRADTIMIFDVIDPDGRWLGPVEIDPAIGAILAIGSDHVLTVWQDEFDVPYLRVYRIRKAP